MSSVQIKLATLLVRELFGDTVANVCTTLLKNGANNLRSIVHETKEKSHQVRKALCVLVQHNIVTFSLSRRGLVEYSADIERALLLVRYPRYVYSARTLYGDIGELIIEEVLRHGQVLMSDVIARIRERLKEALDGNQVEASSIRDRFVDLVNTHFLQRLPSCQEEEGRGDKEGGKSTPVIPQLFVKDSELFQVPERILEGVVSGKRKRASDDLESGRSRKRARAASTESSGDTEVAPDDGIYWQVNFERFHRYFRDKDIISALTQRIDATAGEVVRTMLRLSELTTDYTEKVTKPISFHEIARQMPPESRLDNRQLEQYMKLLIDDQTLIVRKLGDAGGGHYDIDLEQASCVLSTANIESVVQERFGSKSFRIFKTLLKKKYLEQEQIEKFALIPPKEAKELVYQMLVEHFVTVQEIPRTPDHAPSRTFYLFTVDRLHLSHMLLERSYKALINLMSRRDYESAENKRLIDKEQRVEAITASLEGSGAEAGLVEEIQKMMTPMEKEQLQKYKRRIAKLEQSELQVDQTIFVLTDFIRQGTLAKL